MRRLLALLVVSACAGPSQNQLAETPTATSPRRPAEAPAASTSDKDREQLIQQFDDMEATQRAHREAGQGAQPAPKPAAPAPPKKKGPAEAAPVENEKAPPPPKK